MATDNPPNGENSNREKYDVFLSHNSAEKPAVEEIARGLQDNFNLEVFLDKWNLVPGDSWQEDLEEALDGSGCCAVFLGPAGIGGWHNEELRSALDDRIGGGMRVVPVLLPGAALPGKESNLPRFLRRLTWVKFNASVSEEDALHRLYCGIMGLPPGRPEDAEFEDVCPFRGLEVFHEEDERFFFGREAVVQRLEQHLEKGRFLAVLGPSGSGKSSVVRAGLLPRLRREKPGSSGSENQARYLPVVLTPGSAPLEELSFHLSKIASASAGKNWNTQEVMKRMSDDPRGLHYIAREMASGAKAERVILFIDQFEENFTFADLDQRRLLIANVLTALEEPAGNLACVITMRSDFLGHVTAHSGLNAFVFENLFQVEPMRVEELREAIEFPAMAAGLRFEEGLISRIISDAQGNVGELPLIEHALLELYEARDGRRLTLAGYEKIGGIEGALVRRAEQEYNALSEGERNIVRGMFVLRLVNAGGDGNVITRRRALKEELLIVGDNPEAAETVLRRLVDGNLLTTYRDEMRAEDVVEVAHEALIRRWPALRRWLDTHRRTTKLITELGEAAEAWDNNARGDDYLFSGVRLAHFESLRGEIKDDLTPLEQEFLEAGMQRDLERLQTEQAQAQETRAARREAGRERQRAEKASVRTRRLRWLFASALVLGVGAAGAFGWNLRKANLASRKDRALSIWKQARSRVLRNPRLMFLHLKAEALSFVPRSERVLRTSIYMDASTSLPLYRLAGFPAVPSSSALVQTTPGGRHLLFRGKKSIAVVSRDEPMAQTEKVGYASPLLGVHIVGKQDALLTWHEDGSVLLREKSRTTTLVPALEKAGGPSAGSPIIAAGLNARRDRLFVLKDDKIQLYEPDSAEDKVAFKSLGAPVAAPRGSWARFNSRESLVFAWNKSGKLVSVDVRGGTARDSKRRLGELRGEVGRKVAGNFVLEWSGREVRLFNAAKGTATRINLKTSVVRVDPGPSGFALLTADGLLSVRRFADPGGELRRLEDHQIRGGTFGPRGRSMLLWDSDGGLISWNLRNGERQEIDIPMSGRVVGAKYGAGGTRILAWGSDHAVHVLDSATFEQSGVPLLHNAAIRDAWISKATGRVITFDGRHARAWAREFSSADARQARHGRALVHGTAWSADGDKMATWTARRVYIRDTRGRDGKVRVIAQKKIERVAFVNGKLLAWSRNGRASLWDLEPARPVRIQNVLSLGRTPAGSIARPGRARAFTWNSRTAQLWDLKTSQQIIAYTRKKKIRGARFNRKDDSIVFWTSTSAKMIAAQDGASRGSELSFQGRVRDVQHAGGSVILRFKSGEATIWNTGTNRVESLGAGIASRGSLFLNFKDGRPRLLAVWGEDHRLRFVSLADGRVAPYAPMHQGRVLGAVVSQDERLLVTWSTDRSIRLWDIGPLLKVREASEYHSRDIRIRQIVPPRKHDDQILDVVLNHAQDANFMVSRDAGNHVYLWDVSRGVRIGEPFVFRETLRDFGLSPAGDRLMARGKSTVYIRDLPGDISFMDNSDDGFKIMVRALTGTEFDSATREIKPLSPAAWKLQETVYLRLAGDHYEEFLRKYGHPPGRNVFQRFWPEEAKRIRESLRPKSKPSSKLSSK